MRTTVNIHDGLLATAKQRARAQGKTLGDFFEEALQRHIAAVELPEQTGPPLPLFQLGTGLAPGIDPSSNASLYEAMYADEDEEMGKYVR